jgi:MtN3 and saliva related transmembrane protein
MGRLSKLGFFLLSTSAVTLAACDELIPRHLELLFRPNTELPEIVGFLAGLGTTFAALPDLIAMLKRKSSLGMNPRMGTIMGAFQVLWIYYGMLIASRPVIIWNVIAVCINFLTVGAYAYFLHREKQGHSAERLASPQP